MNLQRRSGDKTFCQANRHGCKGCSRTVTSVIIGTINVFINNKPALQVDDAGHYSNAEDRILEHHQKVMQKYILTISQLMGWDK